MSLPQELDRHFRTLLAEGAVRTVLAPTPTSGPQTVAAFAHTADEVAGLVLSPLGTPNLVVHLTSAEAQADRRRFPVAILARPCETRVLSQVFAEHGLERSDVHVVGLGNCRGVIDPQRLRAQLPDLTGFPEVSEDGDELVVEADGITARVARSDVLRERCRRCAQHQPIIHDHLFELVPAAEWVEPEPPAAGDDPIARIDAMAPAERAAYWQAALARCIRCHACRDACPLCYCDDCILDRLHPQWVRRSVDAVENTAYQLHRVIHLLGRCTACGACEEACPVDIPLLTLMRKMEGEAATLYSHVSGADPDQAHALSTFDLKDPEDAVL